MLLGIDAGTGKIAAALVEPASGRHRAVVCVDHQADLPPASGQRLQNPTALLDAGQCAIKRLPDNLRSQVLAVGVTGQMHSVAPARADGAAMGPVITWRDESCDRAFLAELEQLTGHRFASGFGLASMIRRRRDGQWPGGARPISAPDLLTAALGGDPMHIEATMAHSWGFFDLRRGDWDRDALQAVGLDVDLLPTVSTRPAGHVSPAAARRFALPTGVPIYGALGDNQASVLASLDDPETQASLTLGTGGQLSVVLNALPAEGHNWPAATEVRPFPGDRFLAVAACLSGGAAWQWLARSAASWVRDLGLEPPEMARIYRRLNELGPDSPRRPSVDPRLAGERHAPESRGAITDLSAEPLSLGALAGGLAEGIFRNLRRMLPDALLQGRDELIASGNAMRKNRLLQQAAETVFEMPVKLSPRRESAAVGAGLLARRCMG